MCVDCWVVSVLVRRSHSSLASWSCWVRESSLNYVEFGVSQDQGGEEGGGRKYPSRCFGGADFAELGFQ